jgi:hypothetical protein
MALIGDIKGLDVQAIADGAITKYTVVKLSSDSSDGDMRVTVATASTDIPFGIAQETVADGAAVLVRIAGISKISANAAYSLGDELSVAANDGQVDTVATAGSAGSVYVVGHALHAATAASNELPCRIAIYAKYFSA